ncbi:hypothetical protein F8388_023675 [Cannabis sativa]|nr:hypothetical protein F8388_023675 [Cannabis sativa]
MSSSFAFLGGKALILSKLSCLLFSTAVEVSHSWWFHRASFLAFHMPVEHQAPSHLNHEPSIPSVTKPSNTDGRDLLELQAFEHSHLHKRERPRNTNKEKGKIKSHIPAPTTGGGEEKPRWREVEAEVEPLSQIWRLNCCRGRRRSRGREKMGFMLLHFVEGW